jgi:N-acyl-D-amino-acid deacylase
MRNEGERLLQALDEALEIGRRAGVRVQVSHLKSQGHDSQQRSELSVRRIRQARAEGLEVAADRYPYTASNTSLDIVLPSWAQEGGNDVLMERLADPAERKRIRAELDESRSGAGWQRITVASTAHPDQKRFQGMRLTDVAEALGMPPADALLHVIEQDELRTSAFFDSMNEDNMRRVLREPYVMIGSDASLRALSGPLSGDFPHPRAFGTFPRFLRMAADGLMPLPEAVRRMTSLPAEQFRLRDRGVLETGRAADLVVFDAGTVRDRATFREPCRLPDGILHVVVNGVLTIRDGQPTGDRAGRFL